MGSTGSGGLVEANIDLANHLAARSRHPTTSRPARGAELSVVASSTFRTAVPARLPERPRSGARRHQDRIQQALEASGEGWVSTTRLRGATYLRAGILNTQSTADDVDDLLEILRRIARGG